MPSNQKESTTYSPWSEVAKIDAITVQFIEQSNALNANIYGNGVNRVGIEVILNTADKHGNYIQVSKEDIFNNVQLCDYNTGEPINLNSIGNVNNDSWVYTSEPGTYHAANYSNLAGGVYAANDPIASTGYYYLYWASTVAPSGKKVLAVRGKLPTDGSPFGSYLTGSIPQTNPPTVKALPQNTYFAADTKVATSVLPTKNGVSTTNYYISFNQDKGANTEGFKVSGCDYIDSLMNPIVIQDWWPAGTGVSFPVSLPGLILNVSSAKSGKHGTTWTTTIWNYQDPINTEIPYTGDYNSPALTGKMPVNENSNANALCISMTSCGITPASDGGNARVAWGNVALRDQYGNPCYVYFDIGGSNGVTVKDGTNHDRLN